MSNPYDFTSGFLAVKGLQEQRAQAQDLANYRKEAIQLQKAELEQKEGYLKALTRYHNANARKTESDADIYELGNRISSPILNRLANNLNKGVGLSSGGINYSSLNNGFTLGMSLDDDANANANSAGYTQPFDRYGVVKPDYNLLPRARGYVDGTRGGIRLNAINGPGTQDTSLEPNPQEGAITSAVSTPQIEGTDLPPQGSRNLSTQPAPAPASSISGIQMLAERNPKQADTVVRNIFNMSTKEFQQLSGALAVVDFTRGKITSDQMLDQVEKLRKLQAEGVFRAVNEALAGNTEKAKALFAEYGDDNGADIDRFKPIKIKNPVPGAAKGTKDEYDGLEVFMKDGKKITIDPRRMFADIAGIVKSMEFDQKTKHDISTVDATNYRTDVSAESNRVQRETNLLAKQQHEQTLNMTRIGTEFERLRDNELQVLKNLTGKTDLNANSAAYKEHMANVNLQLADAQRLAAFNIMTPGGALQIDAETARQLAPMLTIKGTNQNGQFVANENDPAAAFWNNKNNFVRDKTGKVVSAQMGGRMVFKTINGILLPAPEQVVEQPKPAQ